MHHPFGFSTFNKKEGNPSVDVIAVSSLNYVYDCNTFDFERF